MSKGVVAIVEPYSSAALLAPALRSAGFRPVAVTNPAGRESASVRMVLQRDDYDAMVDYLGDIDQTVGELGALAPRAVIPGSERSLRLAQTLAEALTPAQVNVPALVTARRHKYAMHQALASAGLPVVRQICTADIEEARAWIQRQNLTGRDIVVKPPQSGGTVGVSLAPGGAGWQERFLALLGTTDKLGTAVDEVLIQEYMTGTEYVVDTVSFDGRHSVTDLLRYSKIRLGDGMAIYESMEWLPYSPELYGEIIDYGLAALDAVGLRYWAAHTEIMMTNDGPRLVEINPRLSGIGSPAVTLMATGSSQVTRIVDICRGKGDRLPPAFALRTRALGVFLVAHSTGFVRNAEILDRAKALPSFHSTIQLVRTGDWVEVPTDMWTSMMMGYIVLAHDDADQLYADKQAVRDLEKELVIEPRALAQTRS